MLDIDNTPSPDVIIAVNIDLLSLNYMILTTSCTPNPDITMLIKNTNLALIDTKLLTISTEKTGTKQPRKNV